jgi:signal peptidase I
MEIVTADIPKTERKPWVAGGLSVLLPGLRHVYLGRPEVGVCWFATIQLLVFVYALIARSPLLPPVLTLGGILIPLTGYLFIIPSAVRLARSMRKTYKLKVWNRWYVYLGVLVVGVSLSSFLSDALKEFVVRSYKIPAGSMSPTLFIGDDILVDKPTYRLSNHPERGDIIVFRFPEDEEKDFIKRVVGTPGDTVQLRNKSVLVNGVVLDDKSFTQRIDPGVIDGTISPRDNFGPVTVPDGLLFRDG